MREGYSQQAHRAHRVITITNRAFMDHMHFLNFFAILKLKLLIYVLGLSSFSGLQLLIILQKPSFIIMSCDNDTRNLCNMFLYNSYSYQAYSLDTLIEMRKFQNFVFDKQCCQKNKTSASKTPSWGGTLVIGNIHYKKAFKTLYHILDYLKLRIETPDCLSINNHLVHKLYKNNIILLA